MAASKPTSLLFMEKDAFRLTLNQYLWALTQVWVVPLKDTKLTPGTPTPAFFEGKNFGVWQKS